VMSAIGYPQIALDNAAASPRRSSWPATLDCPRATLELHPIPPQTDWPSSANRALWRLRLAVCPDPDICAPSSRSYPSLAPPEPTAGPATTTATTCRPACRSPSQTSMLEVFAINLGRLQRPKRASSAMPFSPDNCRPKTGNLIVVTREK